MQWKQLATCAGCAERQQKGLQVIQPQQAELQGSTRPMGVSVNRMDGTAEPHQMHLSQPQREAGRDTHDPPAGVIRWPDS